jgi:periplasmic protein CpxP/Spy
MNTHHTWLLGLLIIVSIAAISACHPGKAFRSHFGDEGEIVAHRIDYMVDKQTRTLDLDDGQQTQLRAMAENVRARMAEIREEHAGAKAEVIALVSQDTVEAGEIDDFMDRKIKRIEPVRKLVTENLAAFHAMLSPEQREKLVTEIQNHESGRCRFGGKW